LGSSSGRQRGFIRAASANDDQLRFHQALGVNGGGWFRSARKSHRAVLVIFRRWPGGRGIGFKGTTRKSVVQAATITAIARLADLVQTSTLIAEGIELVVPQLPSADDLFDNCRRAVVTLSEEGNGPSPLSRARFRSCVVTRIVWPCLKLQALPGNFRAPQRRNQFLALAGEHRPDNDSIPTHVCPWTLSTLRLLQICISNTRFAFERGRNLLFPSQCKNQDPSPQKTRARDDSETTSTPQACAAGRYIFTLEKNKRANAPTLPAGTIRCRETRLRSARPRTCPIAIPTADGASIAIDRIGKSVPRANLIRQKLRGLSMLAREAEPKCPWHAIG